MTDIVIEGADIYKKFKKGELYDSLRDLVPALVKQILRRESPDELSEKEFWALEDVSFQVKRGEAFGIIGHNGAGKSTLLKILSGIMKPNKGRIKVNGKLSALLEVGAGFHGDLTGRENIFLNGIILGMSRQEIRQKFDEIVHFSGVEDFIDTPVKRYSSGMYARLGFSVAAHIDPDILLVDEVLSVGDWTFQRKCTAKMIQLIKNGAAVVFISHNLSAVSNLCNNGMLLEHGKVIKTGSADEVINYYLDTVTQVSNGLPTSQVYIPDVTVMKDDKEESRFKAGDKIVVKVNVESKIECHDMAMHIYLMNSVNYQIFELFTEQLDGGGFSLRDGESKEFNVELILHLAAGVYDMGVAVHPRLDLSKTYSRKFPAAKLYIDAHDSVHGDAVYLYPKLLFR